MACNNDAFGHEAVRIHNEYRRKHNSPDMTYNSNLANFAREWALHLANGEQFYHRPNSPYGENIFYSWSTGGQAHTPDAACQNWYDEINYYNWNTTSVNISAVGHFTQMVWKGSTQVGMAMAISRTGKMYVVANYNPRGNIIGHFSENVPRRVC